MENKKEIKITEKDTFSILKIIFIPLLLTFIIEHFGEFRYSTILEAQTAADVRITDLTFDTPFGNTIHKNVYHDNIKYETGSDGIGRLNGDYFDKFPYYIKGVIKDIIYPLLLIGILLVFYFISKKYKIRLEK